jgi:hypothetical protein
MLLGSAALGALDLGDLPAAISKAVGNPFRLLLQNPDAQFIFLLVATPYDPSFQRTVSTLPGPVASQPLGAAPPLTVSGGERIVYLSDKGFKTAPGDAPANQDFPGRLLSAYNFQLDAWGQNVDEPGGGADPGFGDITIANPDASLDAWTTWSWDGRKVTLLAGAKGFAYASFATICGGIAQSIAFDRSTISIHLRDRQEAFNRPVQSILYGGAGALDGGADILGKPKPLCYGQCAAVEPVLVDAVNQVRQIHDGAINAVTRVLDKGVPLTGDGDVNDVYGWSPVAGHYVTCLAKGIIRLGSAPAGRVVADVRGEAGPYVSTVGSIARRIATTRLGPATLNDPADLDAGAFAALDTAFGYTIGIFLAGTETAAQVLSTLLADADGWWTFTRAGQLSVGALKPPANPVKVLTVRDDVAGGFKLNGITPPSWRRRLGYQRVFTVHSATDLAGGVADADRTLLTNEYRFVTSTSDAALASHRLARDLDVPTLLANSGDAATVAAARQALHGVERRVYDVPVQRALFRFFLGDVVQLQRPRFGLAAGQNFVVKGVTEDVKSGQTILRVWG